MPGILATSDGTVSFLTPNNNPLIDLGFVGGSAAALLVGGLLAALLGFAAYTDIFQFRVIKNEAVTAVALISGIAGILLFENPVRHFAITAGIVVFLLLLYIIGVFAEGDLKLYSALALLFAQATVILLFMSSVIILAYSIPTIVKSLRYGSGSDKRGHRLGSAPAGPGIALGFVWLVFFSGAEASFAVTLVAIEAGVLAACCAIFGKETWPKQIDTEPSESSIS